MSFSNNFEEIVMKFWNNKLRFATFFILIIFPTGFSQEIPCKDYVGLNRYDGLIRTYSELHLRILYSLGEDSLTSHQWNAYQGQNILPEGIFFELCGNQYNSEQAKLFRESGQRETNLGFIITLIGGGIAMVGFVAKEFGNDVDWALPVAISGLAISAGGMVFMYFGSQEYTSRWASVDEAKKSADDYNRRLCEELAKKYR
jgi:hypothetical protein